LAWPANVACRWSPGTSVAGNEDTIDLATESRRRSGWLDREQAVEFATSGRSWIRRIIARLCHPAMGASNDRPRREQACSCDPSRHIDGQNVGIQHIDSWKAEPPMDKSLAVAVFAALVLAAVGCTTRQAPEDPKILRFSAIPDQAAAQVVQQHKALVDRICASIKRTCQWVPSESYDSLVDRFGRGDVDVAYFGAATFAQAWHRHGAVPLVMRDIDFQFTSVILVPKTSKAQGLDDLRRLRFSFANRSSTSGHYMLRQRLLDQNITPERHFSSVTYTSDHDATIRAVARGVVDAGGVNASVFYRRVAAGDPDAAALRVVWQTAPFIDYVWAGRRELPEPLRQAIIDAYLDLDPGSAADRPALQAEATAGFVPAFPNDFEEMRSVLRSQGQL
jgi:phosphonate transport system substrate-binding protein